MRFLEKKISSSKAGSGFINGKIFPFSEKNGTLAVGEIWSPFPRAMTYKLMKEDELEQIALEAKNPNTRTAENAWGGRFKKYLSAVECDFSELSANQMATHVASFFHQVLYCFVFILQSS